jgi:hypothetical protein
MGIPIINIAGKIIKAAAGILGVDSVKDVVDAISNNKLTPEQRVAIEAAAQEHEKEMSELALSETNLMIQSEDKYVKRARPTGLYVAYACSITMTVALITGTHIDAAAILTLMGPLYGAQGYYMHLRTKEKMNGNGSE